MSGNVSPGVISISEGGTYSELVTPTRSHTVSFESNGGTTATSQSIAYTFDGWYLEKDYKTAVSSTTKVSTTANHTLYAKWSGTNTITLPTVTKSGYIFVGWYFEEELKNKVGKAGDTYQVVSDQTLYAKWRPTSYIITLNQNGGRNGTEKIYLKSGDGYYSDEQLTNKITSIPELPVRLGYLFRGYENLTDKNGVITATNTAFTSDTTVDVVWKFVDDNTIINVNYNSGNLIYGLNDIGTITNANMSYSISNGVVTVTAKADDGYGYTTGRVYLTAGVEYTFNTDTSGTWGNAHGSGTVEAFLMKDGTYSDAEPFIWLEPGISFTPTVTGEYWLRLDVNATGVTQTFSNISISTIVESKEYTYGAILDTLPTPTYIGHTLNGWYTEENGGGTQVTSDTDVPNEDITYYANWDANTYTVTYDNNIFTTYDSTTLNGISITYDPSTSYLTLNGSTTANTSFQLLTLGRTFTEGQKYRTTFDYISGSYSYTGTTGGCVATDVRKLDGTNYVQVSTRNWSDTGLPTSGSSSSTLTVSSAGASEGTVLYVWVYLTGAWTFTNYKIRVDIAQIETKTVKFGETLSSMSVPTKGYTVTFNGNGGTPGVTSSTGNYTFGGYYTDVNGRGKQYHNASGTFLGIWNIASNANLYAKYTPGTISYPTATRTGHTFNGWYSAASGGTYLGGAGNTYTPTHNKTIYAQWTINKYKFDVNPSAGISSFSIQVGSGSTLTGQTDYYADNNYGTQFTISSITPKTGYSYTGNSLGGTSKHVSGYGASSTTIKVTLGDGNGSIALNSTPINYTISYTLNSGTISGQKTTYNIETASFTLPTPTRSGYTFTGWTGSNGTTPQTSVTIAKGSTGNKSYTANWRINNYQLSAGSATYADTLANAASWLTAGGTITMLNSVADDTGAISKNMTFNTNGKTLTRTSTLKVNEGITATITGSGKIAWGSTTATGNVLMRNYGNLTVNHSGSFTSDGYGIINHTTGKLKITAVTITTSGSGDGVGIRNYGQAYWYGTGAITSDGQAIQNGTSGTPTGTIWVEGSNTSSPIKLKATGTTMVSNGRATVKNWSNAIWSTNTTNCTQLRCCTESCSIHISGAVNIYQSGNEYALYNQANTSTGKVHLPKAYTGWVYAKGTSPISPIRAYDAGVMALNGGTVYKGSLSAYTSVGNGGKITTGGNYTTKTGKPSNTW